MSTAMRKHRVRMLPRSLAVIALVALLAASATVTGLLRASPASSALIWVCLLPLMWAIRSFHPVSAGLVGAGWGLGVCVLPPTVVDSLPAPSLTLLFVLPLLTGAYAAIGAAASRAIRFVTPILAFGWMLVELPLARLHLPGGALLGLGVGDPFLGWIARVFGYALAAFLVVCANASLLTLLSGLRTVLPANRASDESLSLVDFIRHMCDTVPNRRWALCRKYPRGPPCVPILASQVPLAVAPYRLA